MPRFPPPTRRRCWPGTCRRSRRATVSSAGAGKSAAATARAVERAWPDVDLPGIVVTRHGHSVPTERIAVREAAHPVPDEAGLEMTREMLDVAGAAGPDNLVLALTSGGGWTLLTAPVLRMTPDDKGPLRGSPHDPHTTRQDRRHGRPSQFRPPMLRTLFRAGVDMFRLNFSHGAHQHHAAVIRTIRALEQEEGEPIDILQDLQGPKVRLGRLRGGTRHLERREMVTLACAETTEVEGQLPMPHPEIFVATCLGDRLFVDDGRNRLRVTAAAAERLEVEVLQGGTVSDRKGVNLPDTRLDLPVLTDWDRANLRFGLEAGVDWVALFFVQHAEDLDERHALLEGRAGRRAATCGSRR